LAPPARRRIGAIAGRDAATDAGTTAAQANGTDSRRRPRPFALPGGDPPRATPARWRNHHRTGRPDRQLREACSV